MISVNSMILLGGLLGPRTVRVSGTAEFEQCLEQAFSVTSSTE